MPARMRLNDENRKWWTLAAMCFALFMVMLDNTVVNVALPSIQDDLGASLSALEWTVNAYTLTFAVLLVTGGRLGDIFGRRRMFLFGVVVFAVSSATIGLAPTQGWLVASRAVQGVGAAFMMPGTLSIISNTFPPHERGRAIGTWAGVSALALALGPVVGGALAEHVSWRAIFFLNLPVAAGAVAVTLFATRESYDRTVSRAVDYAGIATISVGLTALVLALVEGSQWGWARPRSSRCSAPRRSRSARSPGSSCAGAARWSSSPTSARARSWARTRSRSSSRSRCSRCSSSWRCTCRTSSGTARSRPASASCRARS
jgi:MFS family permease